MDGIAASGSTGMDYDSAKFKRDYAEAEESYGSGGDSGGEDRFAGPPVPKDPNGGPVATTDAGTKDAQKSKKEVGRQIIYTGEMLLGVYNLAEAMKQAEALPTTLGGYVHARREGYLLLKVPAARLQEAMDKLAQLGRVEARNLQADDVTAEFVDLESRIRVLQETQKQLLDLLKQAKTVEEALRVRQALDQVTMELELTLGRMRQLSNLIEFSTLTVNLVERGPNNSIPSSNDPFPWVDSLGVEATEFN